MSTLRNKVTLIGHVGMQPEIKSFDNDRKLSKISLATQDSYKNAAGEWVNNTTWHNVVAWGKTANYFEKNIKKGQEILIEGKLVTRTYESNGEKKYITEVEAQEVMILSSKSNQL